MKIAVGVLLLLLSTSAFEFTWAQMPGMGGGGTSGQTTGTGCNPGSGTCNNDGSSNYVSRSLSFDSTTGIYTGTMTFNLCPNNAIGKINGVYQGGQTSADCKQQTFPAPSYTASKTPAAAPLLGVVGYSMFGVNIFGPFENGFTTGQACSNNKGDCAKGLDLQACENELKYECGGEANIRKVVLGDDCGGHANPYHFHTYLACDASTNAQYMLSASHSPLVGIGLDGRGIYGKYEAGSTAPTDLDACGGHYGPVPGTNLSGAAHNGATSVYHYHTQDKPPFMIGCYGPVASIAACKNLYSTCSTGYETVYTSAGVQYQYDTDCPCWNNSVSGSGGGSSGSTTTTAAANTTTANVTTTSTTTRLSTTTSTAGPGQDNATTTTTPAATTKMRSGAEYFRCAAAVSFAALTALATLF